ncbi:Curli production assembly/transport component CsgF [Fulvivirga imtechensis AK7]|uniref:Curli production assembly/transport component CsgF n=1 Tax=Fulvivirga imtechensis AK7 TaxID=1237149 RepID=L8JXG9_9BACT|nr:curli production assembly/transport component CsgF [Fulvivirga imtechensis]ELR71922.1 Curli production assembly/transport component CsgF [Fulvivirga imtechensis AK7]
MKLNISVTLTILLTIFLQNVYSQDLVYKPVNPAFGGDSFNYQWLLSSAQEQNDFKEKTNLNFLNQDPLKQFEQDLNRQILSQISRRLVTDVFGEEGLKDGTFEIGGFQIEINSRGDGIHIDILDSSNGNETSIIVPYF